MSTDLGRSRDLVPRARRQQDSAWLDRLRFEGTSALVASSPQPPAAFFHGIADFNDGRYWSAHEILEGVWKETEYPLRLFYYGLIKLAVGFLHQERHNAWGARTQFRPAIAYLTPFRPSFLGVQIEDAVQEATARLEAIERQDPWAELDARPRPVIHLPPAH